MTGQLAAIGLVVTVAITVVYAWLFNHTGGSVLMTMLFHIAQGTVSYAALGFTDADAARMDWLTGALWCAIALGLVLIDRHAWRAAPRPRSPARDVSDQRTSEDAMTVTCRRNRTRCAWHRNWCTSHL
ncbi:MAG: protease family protein [Pseudonocardiales bacterium]|nr:protease family protein [Pseudonocardiales bacterium]